MTIQFNSDRWLDYFRVNARQTDIAHWQTAGDLDDDARRLIARSVATFQLGEHSDGRHLLRSASDFAAANRISGFEEMTLHFVLEQQNHAALLGRFMLRNGIPARRHDWTDRIFRRLRRRNNHARSLAVMCVAQLAALSYYRALANATESRDLKSICGKLLCEKRAHLDFHAAVLRANEEGLSTPVKLLKRAQLRGLFGVTLSVVAREHSAVLRAAGHSRRSFRASAWSDFRAVFAPPERRFAPSVQDPFGNPAQP